MIKQIIFDCDGVLVDTEIVSAKVAVDFFKKHKIDLTIDEYLQKYTGNTYSSTVCKLLPGASDDQVQQWVNECETTTYEQLEIIEGMPELVKSLTLPVAVVSNSHLWQVKKALLTTKLNHTVTNFFSSEMVEKPKPAPDVYLLAAEKTGARPDECLVVEDSISGATAAIAAGMSVIGFAGGSHITASHKKRMRQLNIASLVDNPKELAEEIKKRT